MRYGDIAQELGELPQPRGGEMAQLAAVALLERLGDFIEKAQAGSGDPDEHRTAVGIRAVPLDEAVGLEFVDHARDVRSSRNESLRERQCRYALGVRGAHEPEQIVLLR